MLTRSVTYPRTSARRQALDTSLLTMITLLPKMYQEARQDVETAPRSVPNIALTTDIYLVIQSNRRLYDSDCPWLDAGKSFVLQTRQMSVAYTGINIFQELKQQCVEDWNIENKIVAISTGNASNASNAVQVCGWRHILCLAHKINLVVKAAINSCEDVVQVQKRIKDIISYFHRSVKAPDGMKKIQAQLSSRTQAYSNTLGCHLLYGKCGYFTISKPKHYF